MLFATLLSGMLPSGLVYRLKWLLSYLCIRLARASRPKRFDFFDHGALHQPERNGFLSPEIERRLESPFPESHLSEAEDKVLCYGMTSQSDRLVVSVARLCDERAEACVYLRLANGKTYRLKECSGHQQPTGDPGVFSCGGLQVRALCPMRRWRIFFSGFLSETSEEDPGSERMVYVQFAFLWRASSDLFDYSADIDAKLLSEGLARAQWGSLLPPLHKLEKAFDAYSQMGVILGTVSIDGAKEQELYLFGERMRILGTTAYPDFSFVHYLGYVHRDGTFVHFGRASLPEVVNDLHFGFIVQPDVDMKTLKDITVRPSAADSDLRADLRTIHTYDWSGSVNSPRLRVSGDLSDVESSLDTLQFYLNGHRGSGVRLEGCVRSVSRRRTPAARPPEKPKEAPLVVPFADDACQGPELTGGKGSSLGKLTTLSGQLQNFVVPSGIVVTTAAYRKFVSPDIALAIEQLEDVLYGHVSGDVKESCSKVREKVVEAKMPDNVTETILQVLKKHFGHKIRIRKFAIRSSATGEDTEQMSAAGQMDTFLGISGLENILLAVKKCWASQFGYIAVEYKRRYGQTVNSPMAVVIQEMVPCDVAGVMFTCDPLTGNSTVMTITANYGLGETVVSGSEEPDSIELSRNHNDELRVKNKTIGAKSRKIIVTDAEGATLEDVPEQERTECCLSDDMAMRLGRTGVQIEKHYRSRRDIEFGFWNNDLYIFQSRPVTSGAQETDFEIEHEFDAPLRIENEYFSMSNIGEVLPGAMTPLGYDVFFRTLTPVWNGKKLIEWQCDVPVRYFPLVWMTISMHGMIDVPDMFRRADKGKNDPFTSASMVAFMGRLVDDDELSQILKDRYAQSEVKYYPWEAPCRLAKSLLLSGHLLAQTRRKYLDYRVPVEQYRTAEELFDALALRSSDLLEPVSRHLSCTQGSSMWNLFILMTLCKAEGAMDEDVYRDFSTLVTTSSDVESADVPAAIQSLAYHISRAIKAEEFKKMDAQGALQWLKNSSSSAGVKFRDFLDKHGHRCLKEFDVSSIPWGADPRPLVRLLQNLTVHVRGDSAERKTDTFDDLVARLNVPLGCLTRWKLRFLLHMAKRAVQQREGSKSLWVRMIDALRRGYRQLAGLMVSEGRIPDEDILFFMSLEEVRELLRTRSPRVLAKARRRQRLHPKLDKYIFPELMRGFPKPINCDESPVPETDEALTMTGIPVSQGVARGYARVALSLDDATHLEHGEILLTFSTDIGWTPYFPMLAGVVTELGGLISHGAVVSREYGIPCIAGLHGATRRFQTGDYVLLDGNKGTLTKIPPTDRVERTSEEGSNKEEE